MAKKFFKLLKLPPFLPRVNLISNLLSLQIFKSIKGVGVLPALITSFVISGGTLTLTSVSLFSAKSAKNIELISNMESLNINIEQTASSPSLILSSKDHPNNSAFKTCLENNICDPLINPIGITLINLEGDVISNGSGVLYDSTGKICASQDENYCPFRVTSQIEGYCMENSCSGNNIKGFSIIIKVDVTERFKNSLQLLSKQNRVFMSRLEVLNASVYQSCNANEMLIGINNENTPICVTNDEVIASINHRTRVVHMGGGGDGGGDGDGDGGGGSGDGGGGCDCDGQDASGDDNCGDSSW